MILPYEIMLPIPPMARPRPRMVHNGHVYMPTNYRVWLDEVGFLVGGLHQEPYLGSVRAVLVLCGPTRPRRSDLDNYVAGILDGALGGARDRPGLLLDDSQVWEMEAYWQPTEAVGIRIRLEEPRIHGVKLGKGRQQGEGVR